MTNKYFKPIGSILIVGVFLFLALGSDDSKSDNKESQKTTDCSNSKGSYSSGYAAGKLCKLMGDYSSCESFVEKYNYETGRNILSANECYCEGFNDGKSGNPEKYKTTNSEYNSGSEKTTSGNNYSAPNISDESNANTENYNTTNDESNSATEITTDNNNSTSVISTENDNQTIPTENTKDENSSINSSTEENSKEIGSNQILRNPDTRKDFANVFWKKKYTLFDLSTDEPIFPIIKGGQTIYKIYYSTNEDPNPYYGEFTPEQLQNKSVYKFKNKENCMIFCNSKN
jgi:hypothetical protein